MRVVRRRLAAIAIRCGVARHDCESTMLLSAVVGINCKTEYDRRTAVAAIVTAGMLWLLMDV